MSEPTDQTPASVSVGPQPAGGPLRRRLGHLRSGLLSSAVLLVLGLVLGAVLAGGSGAVGAAAGVTLVAVSYTLSSVVIAWADSVNPQLVLPVGLATYFLKFSILGLVLALVAGTGWAGLPAFGIAVMAAALSWVAAQAWWTWHAKIPYVQLERDRR
jgi:hypothetical protein